MCGSVRRLGARPGPAALQSCFANFACNSLFAISKFEFISAELQRFWALLKVHSIELHAKFGEGHVVGVRWGVGARNCSPCSSCWWRKRYKVLPACEKWAEIGVLGLAGRVLYRVGRRAGLAGRVLYRKWHRMRDKVLPARVVGGSSGTKFSLLASNAPKSAFFGVLGEFCTGSTREGCEQGEFCTGPSNQVCRAGFVKPPEPLRITSLLPTGIGRRDVTSPT